MPNTRSEKLLRALLTALLSLSMALGVVPTAAWAEALERAETIEDESLIAPEDDAQDGNLEEAENREPVDSSATELGDATGSEQEDIDEEEFPEMGGDVGAEADELGTDERETDESASDVVVAETGEMDVTPEETVSEGGESELSPIVSEPEDDIVTEGELEDPTETEAVQEVLDEGAPLEEEGRELAAGAVEAAEDKDLSFDPDSNGKARVRVLGVTAGTVLYSAETKTLTLNKVRASSLEASIGITLKLVGASSMDDAYIAGKNIVGGDGSLATELYCRNDATLTVGSGTFKGQVFADKLSVKITGGSIDSTFIMCASLEMTKGSFTTSSCVQANTITISGGKAVFKSGSTVQANTLTISGGKADFKGELISCKSMNVRSGSISVAGNSVDDYLHAVEIDGSLKVTGGKLNVKSGDSGIYVKCNSMSVSGGSVDVQGDYALIECGSLGVKSGSMTFSGAYNGRCGANVAKGFSVSGGTIRANGASIRCGSMGVKSGSVSVTGDKDSDYDPVTISGSLNVSGGKVVVKKATIRCKNMSVKSGSVSVIGTYSGILATKDLNVSGGKVSAKGGGVSCGNLSIKSGSVTSSSNMTDIAAVSAKQMSMSGGKLTVAKSGGGVEVKGNLVLKGGTMSVQTCVKNEDGIWVAHGVECKSLVLKGGALSVSGDDLEAGVFSNNLSMSGGVLKVSKCHDAIRAGKARITGGKVYAVSNAPNPYGIALVADSLTYKRSCFKKIRGWVYPGFTFKVGGNTYRTTDKGNACLVSYGSSKTTAKIESITYANHTYEVTRIAANAFNTKKGRKLKKLVISPTKMDKYALRGTKSLTEVVIEPQDTKEIWKVPYTKCKRIAGGKGISKLAFKGAGKNGGKDLTIKVCGSMGATPQYRTFLIGKGLSKNATVLASIEYYSG